jgi:hypothetical protein
MQPGEVRRRDDLPLPSKVRFVRSEVPQAPVFQVGNERGVPLIVLVDRI